MSCNSRPQILLFGDSLTQFGSSVSIGGPGWATLLTENYMRKADVINRGYSGYNTKWTLYMLDQLFELKREKITFVTILLGANDSSLLELNPKQHVPLSEFKLNLIQLVDFFQNLKQDEEKVVVFLLTPPPINEEAWIESMRSRASPNEVIDRPDRSDEEVKKYVDCVLEVASITGAHPVDLYGEMKKSLDWKKYLEDGLHLSSLGNKFLFKKLMASVEKHAPHLSHHNLPMEFPDWKMVDPNNLEASLQIKK